jgi:hypothetical protein
LVHYSGGLFGDGSAQVSREVAVVPISRDYAVEKYAGNSRQVGGGVLVPDGVSASFVESIHHLGLKTRAVPLFELFGKAGGGEKDPLRYSVRREEARRRRERIAERLIVTPEFFAGKERG